MAANICFRVWVTAGFLCQASAQFLPAYPYAPPLGVAPDGLPANCPATYTSANASGTYPLGPSFVNGPWEFGGGSNESLSWTVSIAQNATSGDFTTYYWLGTPEGIDFRQGNLDYSGCTLFMGGLSQNLIRRAQSDSGNCSETLDNACVTALQNQLESIAMGYVATYTDNSPAPGNLTAGSLPRVCLDISTAFTGDNAVPNACAQFVGPKKTWYDGVDSNISVVIVPITGPNSTTDLTCAFNTSNTIPSFSQPNSNLSLITQFSSSGDTKNVTNQDEIYDEAVTNVYPIFTILFPPANDSNRGGGIVDGAEAFLTCARPVNITAGSRVAAALPSPTPLRTIYKPLRAGAKVGIAVGIVVVVFLITGISAWILISKRRKQRTERDLAAAQEEERRRAEKEDVEKEKKAPLLASEERHEAMGDLVNERIEMPTELRSEMDGGQSFAELDGSTAGELDVGNVNLRGDR